MTQNKTALFDILDHAIELSESDFTDQNTLWNSLQAKMPQALKDQLAQTTKQEFLCIFSSLLAEASGKFNITVPPTPHKTINVLGYKLEIAEMDCETFEDKYNAIYDNAPADLIEKLDALSDEELIKIITQDSSPQ